MENDDRLYVEHILEAIGKIERFVTDSDLEAFKKNELLQSAAMRELGVIGEAGKKLSDDFKTTHDGIPWRQIVGMRDKLIHDYFEIDVEAVWKTIKADLDSLKKELLK